MHKVHTVPVLAPKGEGGGVIKLSHSGNRRLRLYEELRKERMNYNKEKDNDQVLVIALIFNTSSTIILSDKPSTSTILTNFRF